MEKQAIKVLIGPSSFADMDKSPLNKLKECGFEVIDNPYKRKYSKDELLELLPGVKGLIAGLEPLDREVLEKSDLKVISRVGSGMSNVDLTAAQELGIAVKNTPTAPVTAVAELTIGCLLNLLRRVHTMDGLLHQGIWSKKIGRQLGGMVVAIIGFGHIGQRVAQLLLPFGVSIIAVDPSHSGTVGNVPIVSLQEALEKADIITLHCSGDNCLLGETEFALMKEGVYILNVARGGLIDENVLKEALDSGRVAGAWLDTFVNEPYKGILSNYEQVILTPHIGSYTSECRQTMEMEAVNNLIKILEVSGND